MLKLFSKCSSQVVKNILLPKKGTCAVQFSHNISTWKNSIASAVNPLNVYPANLLQSCLKPLLALNNPNINQTRNVTKFSLKNGKKKSVNAVLRRFYRLDTGLWIRRRAGCTSKLHKKDMKTRWNLRQHVFCTKAQCIMFDKMTTDYVKKKKYYIDDPFEPYQVRNNFDWVKPYKPT